MSDGDTVVEDQQADKESAGGLRKQLEDAIKERNKLRTRILEGAYAELGLDPNTGLGKAIAKEYSGEASLDALSEYARDEYGWTPPEKVPESHPQAGVIQQEAERLDSIGAVAGSAPVETSKDLIAKAEAEGDFRTALAMKGQEMAKWFGH